MIKKITIETSRGRVITVDGGIAPGTLQACIKIMVLSAARHIATDAATYPHERNEYELNSKAQKIYDSYLPEGD